MAINELGRPDAVQVKPPCLNNDPLLEWSEFATSLQLLVPE